APTSTTVRTSLVANMGTDELRHVVFVLERLLDSDEALVLALTEAILDRALAQEEGGPDGIISECLALSISLRIARRGMAAAPDLEERFHALFERALAADAPAATEVLDTMDGRSN